MSQKNITHAISGSLSGLVSMVATYPLVTMSTNAQTNSKLSLSAENIKGEDKRENNKGKKNSLITKLIKKLRSVLKFYSGLESALLGIVSVNFIYYYMYNLTSTHLTRKSNSKSLTVKNSVITGVVAGIVSRIVTNPIWVANTRMTVKTKNESESKNTLQVMLQIAKDEGLKGLFAGLVPALILVSSPVIQFTVFEQLKNLIVKLRKRNISSADALILGSFGKLVAILSTYPYYTLRSRMHTKEEDDERGTLKMTRDVLKDEGVGALYRGLNAKLLQSVVSAGLVFYFKEEFMGVVSKLMISVDQIKSKKRIL
ncbi:Ant1 protein [Martiniozyma asiatica (nom. inval.)]|nr:Ant1 protein [Martiniozyma asiatica]